MENKPETAFGSYAGSTEKFDYKAAAPSESVTTANT